MHVDLDAFYAAVEQRDRPDWRGLPVVVGAEPGKRGVVATCSYEARRFGVRSAMPMGEAVRRLPSNTVYVRPRMGHYAAVSRRVMAALESISPVIEQVSIDEAYLDVSGLKRLIGLPASDFQKPDGLTVVPPEGVQAFLDPMPLTVLRGVGVKTAPQLRAMGLTTVADVRRLPLAELRRQLGARAGTEHYQQAQGIADDHVYPATERKSISKETTFGEDVRDAAVLRDTLRWAAQEVGFLARHAGRKGSVVTLKIRLQPFETHNRSRTLSVPTASDREIFRSAWGLFESTTWAGRPVRLIGVGLSGFEEPEGLQPDLFAAAPAQPARADERLDATLDAIRMKFGQGYIQRGPARRK
jgi:DNA polymerase-4